MNFFSKNKDLMTINGFKTGKISIKRLLQFLLGCFIIALAYNIFVSPNSFVPGGVGGIAIILNSLFGIENATAILIMNIALLVISFALLGAEKTKATILGALLFPILIKLTEHANVWILVDTSKVLLSVIFGGILYGFGIGLVFKAGYTTGGTDIVNQIISKYAKISMGKSMLISDGLIVIASGIFFGMDKMLYSIVLLYLISQMSDRVVLGISDNKMFYIITEKDEEIKDYIMKGLNHGVTIFEAQGGYKTRKGNVLMTVLPTKDYYVLRKGIKEIDKKAFFIVTDSYEVVGGE